MIVGTFGHIGNGKANLTAAITEHWAKQGPASFVPFDRIDKGPEEKERSVIVLNAQLLGMPYNVVFLNKVDLVDAPEFIEWELRELLLKYDFPKDDILIIKDSALKAMEFEDFYYLEATAIFELMYAPDARSITGRKKKSGVLSARPTWNIRRPERGLGLKHKRSIIKLTTVMSM